MSEAYKQLEQLAADLGLTLTFEFVPQQFPEGTELKNMGLQWIVNVRKGDRLVLRTTYSQGVAHCPSYPKGKYRFLSVADYEAIRRDCATQPREGQPKEPLEALWSIAGDCRGVSQCSGFEDWATEYGYDPDSRKAEGIYRECHKQWTSLRYHIGDAGVEALANVEL